MKVAYQGVRGAYSEEAALRHFGPGCEPLGLAFSEQVFEAVGSGRADCGLLPVENSIAGPVAANLDLFLKEEVFMIAETYLAIEHCLLGLPGAALESLRSVYSHPVALAQCRDFLAKHRLKAIPEYDTAGSAELVAARQTPGEAAIASRGCAGAYGLELLRENIQTVRDNITRFAVFVRRDKVPPGLKPEKTSLAFSVQHKPGALLDCLRRFADHGINLTRLESRPIPENPFAYVFLVDLLGGLEDAAVRGALDELRREAGQLKVLGSYPLGVSPHASPRRA
ncbi:MAG: prephenate dehydratase [Elusimicrobia bacterium]|nr:prephenate dehydratase [Elusimicrobiota bacterium]